MSECDNYGGTWEGLREVLDDTDNLDKYTDRVEACMRMKKVVNIKKIAAAVAKELGKGYGNIVERVMRRAAARTEIVVEGDEK
jgi:hypothetical protein